MIEALVQGALLFVTLAIALVARNAIVARFKKNPRPIKARGSSSTLTLSA
jgi:hypothetical protein